MKKIILLLLLTITNSNWLIGQNSYAAKPLSSFRVIDESVYVHCNTTTLVTGESCYYKLYNLKATTAGFSTISKIGYIELLNPENQNVLKQAITLENGVGQGDFFIPTTLKTGNYTLIAYTNWTLNKGDRGVFKADMLIINPFEEHIQNQTATAKFVKEKVATDSLTLNPELNSPFLTLRTERQTYTTREKVRLKIAPNSNNPIKGNYSVSIRKKDNLPYYATLTAAEHLKTQGNNIQTEPQQNLFLPELRGKIISGKIVAKDAAKDSKNKTVVLSFPGKHFDLKIVETNEKGNFNFILDPGTYSANATIQVMDKERNDYSIVMDAPYKTSFKPLSTTTTLTVTAKNKTDIENRSIATQIENNYYEHKKDSSEVAPIKSPFYHPLEKDYILDDYNRFPTIKETIVEILFEMYYRREKDNYTIHLRNYSKNGDALGDEALIMVDGLVIQDHNELFDYDFQNVYKVSLINKDYLYGPRIFNGVANFITKKQDYKTRASGDFIKEITLEIPATRKKYFSPDYSNNLSNRIPDFRYQLLWEPETIVTENDTEISFYTSDLKGLFEISLEGFTEKGEAVSIKNYITVE